MGNHFSCNHLTWFSCESSFKSESGDSCVSYLHTIYRKSGRKSSRTLSTDYIFLSSGQVSNKFLALEDEISWYIEMLYSPRGFRNSPPIFPWTFSEGMVAFYRLYVWPCLRNSVKSGYSQLVEYCIWEQDAVGWSSTTRATFHKKPPVQAAFLRPKFAFSNELDHIPIMIRAVRWRLRPWCREIPKAAKFLIHP